MIRPRQQPIAQVRQLMGIGALAMTFCLAFASVGCDGSGADAVPRPGDSAPSAPRVETVLVETRDLAQSIEMPGTVVGEATVELYAKVGGYLKTLHVDIGDVVENRQVLAELDVPEMVEELAQKNAEVALAHAEVEQMDAAIRQAVAARERAAAAIDEAQSAHTEAVALSEYRRTEHERVSDLV